MTTLNQNWTANGTETNISTGDKVSLVKYGKLLRTGRVISISESGRAVWVEFSEVDEDGDEETWNEVIHPSMLRVH